MSVNVEPSAALHWLLSFPLQFTPNFIHMAQESSSTYWVKPSLPTQLNNIASIQVPGTDQIFAGVSLCCRSLGQKKKYPNPFTQPDLTLLFPSQLDLTRLRVGLSLTLRDYPHVAGRLSRDPKTKKWSIMLTNEGIPLITGTTSLPSASEEWFHRNERHPDLIGEYKPCRARVIF